MPLKNTDFSRILRCNPTPVATVTNIMTMPKAMAEIAIFIIGDEILLLYFLEVVNRLAKNNS